RLRCRCGPSAPPPDGGGPGGNPRPREVRRRCGPEPDPGALRRDNEGTREADQPARQVVLLSAIRHSIRGHPMRSLSCPAVLALALLAPLTLPTTAAADGTSVRGEVTDSATGQPVACRIYIEGEDGTWHFSKSEAKAGAAIEYRKQRQDNPRSVEMHTTLSAHPFALTLPPGRYTFTVER